MKKIITFFAMFVLSMGILSAQTVTPTFSYQTVVIDETGQLVVDEQVTVTVTVNYGTDGVYSESFTKTTDHNAMIDLDLGAGTGVSGTFSDIDWSNASITTAFTAGDHTISAETVEVTPVPYAAKAANASITTDMIIAYLTDEETDIEDVFAIMDAIVDNPNNLKNEMKDTVINYMKAHPNLAKEVLLSYLSSATAADVQEAYNAFAQNTDAKNALKAVLIQYIKNHKEMVLEILSAYAEEVTTDDMNQIFAALPAAAKTEVVNKVIQYVKNHKTDLVYPLVQYYIKTVTTSEVAAALTLLENNESAYPVMLAKFNQWMDEYFEGNTNQGLTPSEVDAAIEAALEEQNLLDPDCVVDLCQLQHDVDSIEAAAATTCPSLGEMEYNINYAGENVVVTVTVPVNNNNNAVSNGGVEVSLPGGSTSQTQQGSISADGTTLTISITVLAAAIQNVETYSFVVKPFIESSLEQCDTLIYGTEQTITIGE